MIRPGDNSNIRSSNHSHKRSRDKEVIYSSMRLMNRRIKYVSPISRMEYFPGIEQRMLANQFAKRQG